MMQRYIKLSEYAKQKRINYKTAWKRFNEGLLPNAHQDEFGSILVDVTPQVDYTQAVLYSRVSTHNQKEDLNRQEDRLIAYANLNGLTIVNKYKEIGSGMNDNRSKLIKILNDDSWNTLVVENKDRLTRFGFNYIETLLNKMGKKIIVINSNNNDNEDLIQDLVSIIYSFSARMYGLRRKKNKKEIIEFLEK